ncbi:MAG: ComEC/Rec2 family competence protein, partial [Chitinophagaceae bacterium]|nr:ComEC/Rec2 family competence protein [Chitinophagaceae bacterium]
ENPIQKTKSYKAEAEINYITENGKLINKKGRLILYFSIDSFPSSLSQGSIISFTKLPQPIKSTGNPGSFDYNRYCLFKGITHQAYLTYKDYQVSDERNESFLPRFINSIRKNVLAVLRKYIPGEKEKGLAEALLIGYKDDLDKTLVQSYSNTGVVHIIAISGLHLGLIYWLLVNLLKPLQRKKSIQWLRPVLIIAGLWLFSLLAGAQPSVLRSAVMFTCIVIGEGLNRKASIYNSLAASAFLLLCYNPFWLWDVGFQLSYAAVLSIVIFMQPVYNWFFIQNKSLDFLWKMTAVTIAAQILTVPLSVFHFHQFPNYFLLTNFIAVPVSSLILLGEILLCIISFIPAAAIITGKIISGMIWFMNTWIERVEALPFSLWDGLQVNLTQTLMLLLATAFISYWLLEKQKKGLIAGLIALLGFVLLRTVSFTQAQQQQKLIVYNVPGKKAIDIIEGNKYHFIGDASLYSDDFARNFHLKPSRILNRVQESFDNNFSHHGKYISCGDKKIMMLDEKTNFKSLPSEKPEIDLLVLSGNPKLYISTLAKNISLHQVVIDGSVPAWKSKYWKKDCDSLHIPWHDVSEKGAFVMKLR